jgi:hypothetical protein
MILKIGTNPMTTEVMPYPVGENFDEEIEIVTDKKKMSDGSMIVTITGVEKRVITLRFKNKTIAEFNRIKPYCNTYPKVFVDITNNTSTREAYNGYSYIEMIKISNQSSPDDGLKNFEITIYEL